MASPNPTTVKFLCSYGGRITPRYPDGKLRYKRGHTRVLSVSRSISFTELERKIGEICGMKVNIRCQLPTDDLDALVTVSSDEDLTNLMEEYDMVKTAPLLKIHAFLTPPKSMTAKTSSPPLSTASSSTSSSSSKSSSRSRSPSSPSSKPENCSVCVERSIRNNGGYVHRSPSQNQFYQIHY